MKVCFIEFAPYRRGHLSNSVHELATFLSKRGHSIVVLVYGATRNIRESEQVEIRVGCRKYSHQKFGHLVYIFKLIALLKKERFDVIHVRGFVGSFLVPFFCRRDQGVWIYEKVSGKTEGSKLNRFIYDKLSAFGARFFDQTTILNEALRDKIFGEGPVKNVSILPLGASIAKFSSVKKDKTIWRHYGFSEEDTILIYIGDMGPNRHLDEMFKAFQLLKQRSEFVQLKLVMVGGSEEDRAPLKSLRDELSLSESIVFTGVIPYEDAPRYLVSADIGLAYIPKSDIFDVQLPLKTFEYLAASLAVVATDTVGNLEAVEDGVNGVITTDDYRDFATGIMRVLRDSELQTRIRNNAHASVGEYDWACICEKVLALYGQLLDARKKRMKRHSHRTGSGALRA